MRGRRVDGKPGDRIRGISYCTFWWVVFYPLDTPRISWITRSLDVLLVEISIVAQKRFETGAIYFRYAAQQLLDKRDLGKTHPLSTQYDRQLLSRHIRESLTDDSGNPIYNLHGPLS